MEKLSPRISENGREKNFSGCLLNEYKMDFQNPRRAWQPRAWNSTWISESCPLWSSLSIRSNCLLSPPWPQPRETSAQRNRGASDLGRETQDGLWPGSPCSPAVSQPPSGQQDPSSLPSPTRTEHANWASSSVGSSFLSDFRLHLWLFPKVSPGGTSPVSQNGDCFWMLHV